MEAQQTFIIEASRQNSIEVNSNTKSTNFSSWTNRIEPTLLKKGDYVSVNTAIVNQKGASGANNIEFSDEYNNPNDNLQQNFTMITTGFYVCNNNVNSCPLPFQYNKRLNPPTDPTRLLGAEVQINFDTTTYKLEDGQYVLNNEYGMGEWRQIFTDGTTPNNYTCDELSSFVCKNPHIKIDGRRYAKVGTTYQGFQRPYKGVNATTATLLEQDIPLFIERGFKDASSVGDTLTSILQSTNEPYSNTADTAVARSDLYTEAPNEIAQTQINPRFNGYCMKTIAANLQPLDNTIDTTAGVKGGPLYNNLCVDDPFKWKYGTQLLSNATTHGFLNSPVINTNYEAQKAYVSYDYPMLIWVSYSAGLFDDASLNVLDANYSFYSPHFSTVEENGGDDILQFKNFSSTMVDYNDAYAEIHEYDPSGASFQYGSLFFKSSTTQYTMRNPQSADFVPKDDDGNMVFLSFLDSDAVDFSRIIGYSPKMDLGGDDWVVKGENVARAVPTDDFFTDYTFPTGDEVYYTRLDPYETRAWVVQGTSGGSNGKKYIQSLGETGFQIVSGRKYRYSFTTKFISAPSGSSSAYPHAIGIEDKSGTFGMPGVSITADGTYTQEFTATANASGTDIIEFFYDHATPYNMVVEVTDFVIMDYSLEQGDIYLVEDIFWDTTTNNTSNKFYSLQISSNQLRNVKINLANSYLADFNQQYTAYSQLKAYTSGSNIIAFNGASPNDYDDAVILLYQGNAGYDLVIFNEFGSKKWIAAKITKFTGNTIESGTTLGTYSDLYTLKDPPRAGQQYYNFASANNYSDGSGITKYALASGNSGTGWKDYPPPSLEFYNFTDVVGTSSSGFDYDHTYQRTSPASSNIVYLKTTAGTNGLQGTARFDGGGASAIWNGTWTLTTSGGVDGFGALTLNGTVVSSGATFTAVFNAQATLTLASGAFAFTNHIADPLPVIDTDKQYFQSIVHAGTTYYLGANSNGAGDDTDKEGKRGRLIYSTDGGASYTTATWNWNGSNLIDMNGVGGNIALTTTGTVLLTDTITYTTKQDVSLGGTNYAFPVDGKIYGVANEAGTTTKSIDLHNPLPVSSITIDKVYLANDNATQFSNYDKGSVYESQTETTQGNRICQWYSQINNDNTVDLVFHETGNTNEILLIIENSLSSTILEQGWRLFKSSVFDYAGDAIGQILTIQNSENFRFTNSRTTTSGKLIPNEQSYSINSDTGNLTFSEDGALNITKADMPKSTMLMTNIEYTLDNIKMVENYYRYTEIYDGNEESSRKKISEDIENFYTKFDIGRTDDSKFEYDRTIKPYYPAPYTETDGKALTKFTDMDYGMIGVDDSDENQFTDWNGTTRKGTNKNFGMINPRAKGGNGEEQRIKVFTRWKGNYVDRLVFTNRLENSFTEGNWDKNGFVYGKYITEEDFKSQYEDLYNYVSTNNVGVFPYLARDYNNVNGDGTYNYKLCMSFETYEAVGADNPALFRQQHGTYFGFSPSFLDHNYITTINTDTPFVNPNDTDNYGAGPQMIEKRNMNYINIGAAPTISYNTDQNRFVWQYLHTPFFFNEITGTDADLGEEVAFLNSNTLMIMGQGIGENNLESGGDSTADPVVKPQPIHLGVADAQCGIFIIDLYGQTPRDTYITDRANGIKITQDNYDNTLFWTLGFSYYDLKPIRFVESSFNNRFNRNTYNTISTNFKKLGTSPFTTNSAISVADQQKTNIFSGANYHRVYDTASPFNEQQQTTTFTSEGTPQYYLGFNNLQAVSIKTSSAFMSSRSVIVNLTAPFYRIYCNIPLDTLTYLTDGSLSCAGYMTKNYQSQSFIYSFASDYGGYLTRDVLLTDLRTEIRNPAGLQVNSIDSNSAVFYKITRTIKLETPDEEQQDTPEVKELKDIEEDIEELNENIGGGRGGRAGDAIAPSEGDDEDLRQYIDERMEEIVMNLVGRTVVGVNADEKDIARRVASGVASYFTRRDNIAMINKVTKDIEDKGINALNDKDVRKFVGKLQNYYINVEGKALRGSKRVPDQLTLTREGARRILDGVFELLGDTPNPRQGTMAAKLQPIVGNLILNTQDLVDNSSGGGIPVADYAEDTKNTFKEIKALKERGYNREQVVFVERLLTMPFDTLLATRMGLNKADIKELKESGRYDAVKKELIRALQLFRRGAFNGYRMKVNRVRHIIMDELPDARERVFDELIGTENITPAKFNIPRKSGIRRTPQEKAEAKSRRKEEDKDAPEKGENWAKLYREQLGKRVKDLTPQEKAEYRRLGREYALQFGKKIGKMKESRSIYKSPVGFQYGSPLPKMKFTKARPRKDRPTPRKLELETKKEGGASK